MHLLVFVFESFIHKTDLICCFATAPGNYAVRDSQGSPFIQTFCREVKMKRKQSVFQENHSIEYENFIFYLMFDLILIIFY